MNYLRFLVEIYSIAKENFQFSFLVILAGLFGSYTIIKKHDTVIAFAIRLNSYLAYIAVRRNYRGRGYGKLILKKVKEKVRSLHVKTTDEHLLSFYNSHGFEIKKQLLLPTGKRYLMVKSQEA
ncbi:MAG: GNAT family N-acetyltransferase [Nanobdellota archaeon]